MKEGSVVVVSLGPGEPELLSVKALNAMKRADIIYCPGTKTKSGEIKSRALDIVKEFSLEDKVFIYEVPMSKDRNDANEAYDLVCNEIMEQYAKGKKLAITAEGDSGFYSSANYILEKLSNSRIDINTVAGIPAFIAAGALSGLHIVKQEEKLVVLPGNVTTETLAELHEKGFVIVVMKLSQCEDEIKDFIINNPQSDVHYYENIGSDNEIYKNNHDEIIQRKFPYFSLIIIKL